VIVSLRELEDGVPETKQTPQVRGRAYGRRPDDRPGEREALPDRIDGSSASPQIGRTSVYGVAG